MGLSISVQVLRGGETVGDFSFDSDHHRTIKIGRLTSAQIKLEDPKVSRIHAVIEFSGVDASLIDLGSTQGTSVNGSKVTKVKLSHGDRVMVGDTTLVVAFSGQADVGGDTRIESLPADDENTGPMHKDKMLPPLPPAEAPVAAHLRTQTYPPPGAPAFAGAPGHWDGATAPPAAVARAPHFDPGLAKAETGQLKRLTSERLRAATAEKPHPGLPPEDPVSRDNRVVEMRYYWGDSLLGMYHYHQPKQVTIGENNRTNIFLSSEGLPVEEFPLLRYIDGDYYFTFTSQMEGEVETGGKVYQLQEARTLLAQPDGTLSNSYRLQIADDARLLVHWGGATFALRFVPPAKWIAAPFGKNIDLHYVNAAVLSLFLHIAVVLTLTMYPHDADSLKVDLFGEPDRFASLILETPKPPKATTDMLDKMKKQIQDKKEEIKPKEEKVQPTKVSKGLDSKVFTPRNIPNNARSAEADKKAEVAKRFGKLFGGIGTGGGAGNLLGGGGGGSLSGTLQNVIGTAGSGTSSAGLAGMGVRGTGPLTGGGLGTSRGIGGIGTSGRLGGGGIGYGAGAGSLGAGKGGNMVDFETPVVEGALSADIIKKIINQNRNQIRYCYEVELQHNQNLEGRVLMHWVIGGDGYVQAVSVKDSSMHNANVERCMAGKIKTWKFPAPAGGGTVEVNYPFVFKAS